MSSLTNLDMNQRETLFTEFRREALLTATLSHCQYLVKLYGVCLDAPGEQLVQMIEFCPKGDLCAFIKSQDPLDWEKRLRIALDIAKGMQFLHNPRETGSSVCHLDLKSPNVLLTSKLRARIADFGLSQSLGLSNVIISLKGADNAFWLAPEILTSEPITLKADCYSFAIVLWELAFWKLPFNEYRFMYEVEDAIVSGDRPKIDSDDPVIEDCPQEFFSLMRNCWNANPAQRPTFDSIVLGLKAMLQQFRASKRIKQQIRFAADDHLASSSSMPSSEMVGSITTKSNRLSQDVSQRLWRRSLGIDSIEKNQLLRSLSIADHLFEIQAQGIDPIALSFNQFKRQKSSELHANKPSPRKKAQQLRKKKRTLKKSSTQRLTHSNNKNK